MAATSPNDLRFDRRTGTMDRRNEMTDRRRDRAHARGAFLARTPAASVEGIRVSWGGIWGGVLSAMGLMLLLGALGMALGITALSAQAADGATMGMAAAGYVGLSLLISLFMGGLVATRIGATYDSSTGFWEGALVWVVTLLLMGVMASTGVSTVADGAMGMLSAMPDTGGGAAQSHVATVTPIASKAAWMGFAGLLVSLMASLFGAMAGRRRAPVVR